MATPGANFDTIEKEDQIPRQSSAVFRNNSMMFQKLLSEADINRVKDKFYEDANI